MKGEGEFQVFLKDLLRILGFFKLVVNHPLKECSSPSFVLNTCSFGNKISEMDSHSWLTGAESTSATLKVEQRGSLIFNFRHEVPPELRSKVWGENFY